MLFVLFADEMLKPLVVQLVKAMLTFCCKV